MITIARTAADTNEHVICAGPCKLYAILPELLTTGTITVRDSLTAAGGTATRVGAIGLSQAGLDFQGATFLKGLTVQLSVSTDLSSIIFEKITSPGAGR